MDIFRLAVPKNLQSEIAKFFEPARMYRHSVRARHPRKKVYFFGIGKGQKAIGNEEIPDFGFWVSRNSPKIRAIRVFGIFHLRQHFRDKIEFDSLLSIKGSDKNP